jgi:AcrR family transcriptional regulator
LAIYIAVNRFRVGYDAATLRDISAEAVADVALIKRYFGGKQPCSPRR